MNGFVSVKNECARQRLNIPLARRIGQVFVREIMGHTDYDLTFIFVDDPKMRELNETIVGHEGTTDVITLDYCEPDGIVGTIYICLPEAKRQSRVWKTIWQEELARYMIHGVLHLSGYDDLQAAKRKRMKAAEDKIVEAVRKQFDLSKIEKTSSGL